MTQQLDTDQIAKFIFDRHAESMGQRADRVAFMVTDGDAERQAGGLCEGALADWIRDAIREQTSEGSGS